MSDSIARIEQLLADAETLPDPQARALARSLAASLVDMVGDALRRAVELGGPELGAKLAGDELVGNLFVLCGMHPDAPAVRARRALENATKELSSVGAILDGVDEVVGGIRVRLRADPAGVGEAGKVRSLVEAIVMTRAPDVESVQIDLAGKPVTQTGFVSVERLKVVGAS